MQHYITLHKKFQSISCPGDIISLAHRRHEY